jgi:hypothetical protein
LYHISHHTQCWASPDAFVFTFVDITGVCTHVSDNLGFLLILAPSYRCVATGVGRFLIKWLRIVFFSILDRVWDGPVPIHIVFGRQLGVVCGVIRNFYPKRLPTDFSSGRQFPTKFAIIAFSSHVTSIACRRFSTYFSPGRQFPTYFSFGIQFPTKFAFITFSSHVTSIAHGRFPTEFLFGRHVWTKPVSCQIVSKMVSKFPSAQFEGVLDPSLLLARC